MTKVYQRNISNIDGDCMQAAIASLFDIRYEDTPAFIKYPDGYAHPLFKLIKDLGYDWNGYLHNAPDKENLRPEYSLAALHEYRGVNGIFYATVISPKYFDPTKDYKGQVTHAVLIDKNYNIIHDPNPENQALKEYPMAKELGYNGILHIILIDPK